MKFLLCISLLFLAAQPSESACYLQQKNATAKCIDPYDGAVYAVGESWINPVCVRCSCGEGTVGCCDVYSTPRGYSEDCDKLFNPLTCQFRVYRRDDPSIECPVHGGVGK
ncbi:beta-microseminoprotein-like [Pristis pectinata]|uniref:beta-microseminoprotein-like n=1 Tax=Pristis pectinata TaxID=685728 RepID=UPI00223E4B02|nr:beta-microseminoprotein-like [Pristis pectinata]